MTAVDPITGGEQVADDLIGLVSKFVPDREKAVELATQIQQQVITAATASDTAQATIDAAEAASSSIWSKPHLIACYFCMFAVFLPNFIVPMLQWIFAIFGIGVPRFPLIDDSIVESLMWGLFGLSGVHIGGNIVNRLTKS